MPVFSEVSADAQEHLLEFFNVLKGGFMDAVSKMSFDERPAGEVGVDTALPVDLAEAHGDKATLFYGFISGKIAASFGMLVNEPGLLATLTRMLMMDDDEAAKKKTAGLDKDDLEAVKEFGSQVFSNIGVHIGSSLGGETTCRLEDVELDALAGSDSGFLEEDNIAATCAFGDSGAVTFLLKDDLFAEITGSEGDLVRPVGRTGSDSPTGDSVEPVSEADKLKSLMGLSLPLTVVLAEKKLSLSAVIRWTAGTIIEFDKNHEEMLDLYVSSKSIALEAACAYVSPQ